MPGYNHLFIPGPTNIPEAVRQAMNVPMEDMRAPDFPELTLPLFEDVKKVFKNENGRVFIYPSSGTGAWEAAITNMLSPGDQVLMSRFGQFSHLWVDMAQRLGLDVDCSTMRVGHGRAGRALCRAARRRQGPRDQGGLRHPQRDRHRRHLATSPRVRAALDAAGHPALLFVDGVSSIGSHRLPAGRVGRRLRRLRLAEGLHAARRPRLPRRQPEGAGGGEDRAASCAATSPSTT